MLNGDTTRDRQSSGGEWAIWDDERCVNKKTGDELVLAVDEALIGVAVKR